jgi:F420-dependent oxidoreductase-like protein
MRVGLQVPNLTFPGGAARLGQDLARVAVDAEAAGFDSLWVMDHFFQIEFVGPAENDMLEGYTTLAYFAALTKKIKLGTMVTGVTYRHPGVLLKTMTTLDVLSGGRAYLGIGAAWFEREHLALGVPYPPLAERFERLEETLQIAQQMWSPNNGPFQGKHYQLAETLCVPQPLTQPHPPILIGGMGEQKTLRLVARYAQACNLFQFAGVEALRHKLSVLRQHCQDIGRDYSDIEKTTLGQVDVKEPNKFLEELHQLGEIGIDSALFGVGDPTDPQVMKVLAEVIVPQAHKISVRRS